MESCQPIEILRDGKKKKKKKKKKKEVSILYIDLLIFLLGATGPPPVGQGLHIIEASRSHTTTHHSR